jgi:hypothetical protein
VIVIVMMMMATMMMMMMMMMMMDVRCSCTLLTPPHVNVKKHTMMMTTKRNDRMILELAWVVVHDVHVLVHVDHRRYHAACCSTSTNTHTMTTVMMMLVTTLTMRYYGGGLFVAR